MSSLGSPNPLLFGAAEAYEIDRSLRFNSGDSPTLTRTFGTPTNTDKYTFSVWFKRAKFHDSAGHFCFLGNEGWSVIRFTADRLYWKENGIVTITTTRKWRDPASWYHVVLRYDSSLATSSDRAQIWVNGVRETDFTSASYPSQNQNSFINSAIAQVMGGYRTDEQFFDGYMAEINFVDGQGLDPDNFGKTDPNTGQWIPQKYTGTYGDNGYYLKFDDNSGTTATTLGKDSSGNDNNWTPNNFSVAAGTGNDSVVDTPTNNYCVLNGVEVNGNESPGTLTQGGLEFTADNNYACCPGTFSLKNGKYYWEVTYQAGTQIYGIMRGNAMGENAYVSYDPNGNCPGLGIQANNGTAYGSTGDGSTAGGSQGTSINSLTTNDVMAFASDIPNGTLKVYKGSGGSRVLEATFTGFNSHDWFPAVSGWAGEVCQVNFGSNGFKYTPPTGYVALCTANLSEPTIKKGTDYFNTLLWSGNNTSGRGITGVGFQPDFVWIKSRSHDPAHQLFDAVRGGSKVVQSNGNGVEQTNQAFGYLSAFNSDGFTLTEGTYTDYEMGNVNMTGRTYVGWNWKGAGSTTSNGTGSVTASVSANTSAGFSIVTWTGTSGVDTIGHGLGVAPELIIVKKRNASDNWLVFSSAVSTMGADKQMYLDLNNSVETNANIFNDAPSSSVFTVGSWSGTATMLAYCFASVEGYCKIGFYKGNGNAYGTFVYTGFKPAFVLIKSSSNAENWNLFDNTRDPDNFVHHLLVPNTTTEENSTTTARRLDFLSNGFKIRGSDGTINTSNYTYIYMAIAESPFKYANARA